MSDCHIIFQVLFSSQKLRNELHFRQNELFIFYSAENEDITLAEMRSKNYGIPW